MNTRLPSINDFDKILRIAKTNKDVADDMLRQIREKECYTIVNRGDLWYKRLNEVQKVEFDQWYQQWLDVTDTYILPTKPIWLK